MKILLGVPSSGMISEGSSKASWLASLDHDVIRVPSCDSGPNFNRCWVQGLNAGMKGEITHFAMLHADLTIIEEVDGKRWLDILIAEMEAYAADFISVPVAIKDHRGLTSAGVGTMKNRWNPHRRFTVKELQKLPPTFNAEQVGYTEADKYLIHSGAVCCWDMRQAVWYKTDAAGRCRFVFNFEEDIRLDGEQRREWKVFQDSEDWAFSKLLRQANVRDFMTSKIKVAHHGSMAFANWGQGGTYTCDEDTKPGWQADGNAQLAPAEIKV